MKDGRAIAQQLVDQLKTVLGPRLQSATLYGSVARGEEIPGVSDVNVMVLIDDIDPRSLTAVAPVAQRWLESGQRPPLLLEREQWRRSADVFAIELADMRDAHIPLFGADPISDGVTRKSDLRNQAEHELRGKLLQLQTGMLMTAAKPEALGGLLMSALPSFVTYLRALLRIKSLSVPGSTPDVIRSGLREVNAGPAAFLEIWEARQKKSVLKLGLQDALVNGYHSAAEATVACVDQLREVGE
jgi:predicted nucleotidyltransferase